jgi:Zn-finger nucleic acid-binding protein
MQCPTCSAKLRAVSYEDQRIHTCDACGGEFLGPDELRHIVATTHERFGAEWQRLVAGRTPRFGVPAEELERSLECPACASAMTPINYAGDTAVYVDRCGGCGGVWLDHDELEKIQVIVEQASAAAPTKVRSLAMRLEDARASAAERSGGAFAGSRFSFVNAIINRLLDAA